MHNHKIYDLKALEDKARLIRIEVIKLLARSGNGHFGGSLSCADLITALYFHELNIEPLNPSWPDRDRFIMSKGHGAPTLYIALGELGYFPKSWWFEYEKLGSALNTHPDMKRVPGLDFSAGSLGHGMSVGVGMALAGKIQGKQYRTFVLVGDGELHEGSNWEAAMAASHYGLDRLVVIVDRNQLCVGGPTEKIMGLEPLDLKFKAFGWEVNVIDGHHMGQILEAFRLTRTSIGKPRVIIANTVKGKGVSFMESRREWHGNDITPEQLEQALKELGEGVGYESN